MRKRKFDGKFLDYPLYCLAHCAGDGRRLIEVTEFCVIQRALNMGSDYKIKGRMKETYFNPIKMEDFDIEQDLHKKISMAAKDLGIELTTIDGSVNNWITIKNLLITYEEKYDIDAYCRMPRQLTYEVLQGKFTFREYCILAAIQSILGKSNTFYRITNEQICYRMHGYKTKEIALKENKNLNLLSDRQIAYSVGKLKLKNLIRTATYGFREKYYSTKIKYADTLRELISKKKLTAAENKYNVIDREWTKEIKREIKKIKVTKCRNTRYLDTYTEM